MSIFAPLPVVQIERNYTHTAWLLACPVYLQHATGDVAERNGVPEVWFHLNLCALMIGAELVGLLTGADPLENGFPFAKAKPLRRPRP